MRKLFPTIFLIAISIVGILYGQRLVDTALAHAFQPSAQVAAVQQRLELTDRGTDLLYASQASIEDKQQFNTNCQSGERTAAILGCYYKRHIYLFNITNPQLDGAVEVTAAHEMLHAAYERLNFFEKAHVDQMIQAEYEKIKTQPAIAEEMKYYQQAEPGAETNELHSIIGTTIASISPELETYYAQYFHNRADIVALNTKYNAVFTELTKKAEVLQASISAEQPVIKSQLDSYDKDKQQLETDIQSFNDQASSQGFSSQSNFSAARSSLLARVAQMNARRNTINQQVNNFNALVAQLNDLSVQVSQINQSLNGAEATSGI